MFALLMIISSLIAHFILNHFGIPWGSSATEILSLLDVYSPTLLIYIYIYIYINGEIIINSANMYLINLYLSAFAFRLHQRSKINKKLKKLSYNIYIFKSNMNEKTRDDSNKLIEQIYPLNGDHRIQTVKPKWLTLE